MSNSLQPYLKQLNEIKYRIDKQDIKHLRVIGNELIINSYPKPHNYIPSTTADLFHLDDSFVRLVMGAYGSGKSTMCCAEIVKRACSMPFWYRGRRKSKWIIIRNTSAELESTTLQTWLTWFGELGDIQKRKKPLLTYDHFFNDGKGIVELTLIFIALDREEDIRRLKSLEATGGYINELSEVPQAALSHLKGRVNHRYPSPEFCKESYWSGIIADTNPPDEDHWIHNDFELKGLESYKIFKQPAGLIKDEDNIWIPNIHCDNYKHLSSDYYTKLAEGQSEDFIKVYCLGEYGSVGFGKRVYPEYNDDIHCSDKVKAMQGEPIHLGWDFGLTPACVVVQFTPKGQLLVLREYTAEDTGIKSFAENIVLPSLQRDFPYCKIGESRADPSGAGRDEIMEELSCIGVLNAIGIKTIAARTNDISTRIAAVKYFLNKMVDGKPAFVISKTNAPVTRKGFIKDYCFKRIAIAGEERYRDIPDKNFASHAHDGLQYIALDFASDYLVKQKQNNHQKVDMYNPSFRYL